MEAWKQWATGIIGMILCVALILIVVVALGSSQDVGDVKRVVEGQEATERLEALNQKQSQCRAIATGERIALLVDFVTATGTVRSETLALLRSLDPLVQELEACNKLK